jgi:Fe-S cluster biogenesis protein NfuA
MPSERWFALAGGGGLFARYGLDAKRETMAENHDFPEQAARINALVGKVDALSDHVARATALELLQEVMGMNASVLDRMLNLMMQAGDPGLALVEKFTDDPLISGLLVLYDLHPETLETRLAKALDKARPSLRSHGGDVELTGFRDGVATVRLTGSCNGCSGSTATMKTTVEQAIFEAAPEVASVVIEGAESQPVSQTQTAVGFVPLAKLQGAA